LSGESKIALIGTVCNSKNSSNESISTFHFA